MSKGLLYTIALVMGITGAQAADLAVKAPVSGGTPCTVATATTPLSCSGFYVGGGLGGQGSNADIIGSGIVGSVFAGGITPTIDAGYQYMQGNWIFGAELDTGYSVGTGASINGVGGSFNGFRVTEDFQLGGNLNALFTQPVITVPASLSQAVLGLYAHVGTSQWQLPGAWANGIESGAGVKFDISTHWFGDIRYTYTNFSAARAGGLTINDDNSVLAMINYKF
jgi:opacity protein-like surface antigen